MSQTWLCKHHCERWRCVQPGGECNKQMFFHWFCFILKNETWNHVFLMRLVQLQRYQCFDPQPYGVLMCFVLAWKLRTIDPHRFQVVRLGMTHHGGFVGCLFLAHAHGVETQTTLKKHVTHPLWKSCCVMGVHLPSPFAKVGADIAVLQDVPTHYWVII